MLARLLPLIALAALCGPAAALAQDSAPSPAPAPVTLRFHAAQAHQGAASDGTYFYAISNDAIGKYRIATGEQVAEWHGQPRLFPHMNSCTVVGHQLVCAASNYPALPQTSAVEFFDTRTMTHLRTVSLGLLQGSLTVMDRHAGHWWAVLANYTGKGGDPARGAAFTQLVQMDAAFHPEQAWVFPEAVLARMAPKSCSGLSWGPDGYIYATGHDRPEVYVLRLPEAGSSLELVTTLGLASAGQAIDWDPKAPRRLWSIGRGDGEVLASTMPQVRQ
ncbi:hypothetical protein MTR62_02230 [Novosphingobium sp. 1949]|uniref:WD40 repeat domain-containing protein n=1 Tax=Novosphingobium organovorum TaxID=2930092 RepID=A0ABT0B9L9_9SPHN|nr:hypothetical protein [Novosphingobium organovorum]MCJ2181531.1 hypothetical protein [Novosphingobium organovorum]